MSPSASLAVQMQKLNTTQRKEVADFIEFLLARRTPHSTKEKTRRERLTKISVWSNEEVRGVEKVFNGRVF